MKQIEVVYYLEDHMVEGGIYRTVERGYLLTPEIAVTPWTGKLLFLNVAPSVTDPGFYDNVGDITEIDVPDDVPDRVASLPPAETLSFAMWVAGILPSRPAKNELLAGLIA
ncbi:hypothetical protein [Paenibacillus sp. PAMC21692]|uniref:hypothetical protein n=1 Tax=Paenibacillus sp. PAMC21692 TaxID=2762320 RepID=UPI00164D5C02|nr:hypothetical protein [Paenibacillus sp. PAMC21692]QNK54547.1 hypothetical protein H7F31_17955 [Paenibacillus sp. PAMC21692]